MTKSQLSGSSVPGMEVSLGPELCWVQKDFCSLDCSMVCCLLKQNVVVLFLFVLQLYLWGSPFWVRFLHVWPFFNPAIKVVTFHLCGCQTVWNPDHLHVSDQRVLWRCYMLGDPQWETHWGPWGENWRSAGLPPLICDLLFALDWIMCEMTKQGRTGIQWSLIQSLEDPGFADNLCLADRKHQWMQTKTDKSTDEAARTGLCVYVDETELRKIHNQQKEHITLKADRRGQVYICGQYHRPQGEQERTSKFDWGKQGTLLVPYNQCGGLPFSPSETSWGFSTAVSKLHCYMDQKHSLSTLHCPTSCKSLSAAAC